MAKKRKYSKDVLAKEASETESSELVQRNGLPVSAKPLVYDDSPDGLMSVLQTGAIDASLQRSRRTWLSGCMFEKFWTRPQRGRKLAEGQFNARDKMTKLCECSAQIGPHFFELRLFTVKDDAVPRYSEPPVAAVPGPSPASAPSVTPAAASSIPSQPIRTVQTPQPNPQQSPTATPARPAGQTQPAAESSTPATQPAQPVQPAPPPPSARPAPAKTANEVLIERLHALARKDPQFGDLMKLVASGKASPDDVRRFQIYISHSNQLGLSGPLSSSHSSHSSPSVAQPYVGPKVESKNKEFLRDQTLVFEFKENPTDRFLFPKNSLVRLMANGTISCEFLIFAEEPKPVEPTEVAPTKKQKKKADEANLSTPPRPPTPKYYTPLEITLFGIPRRNQETLMRSVNAKEDVIKYLIETTSNLKRTQDWWISYRVNPSDLDLVDKAVEPIGHTNPNAKKKPWSTIKDADDSSDPSTVYIKHMG